MLAAVWAGAGLGNTALCEDPGGVLLQGPLGTASQPPSVLQSFAGVCTGTPPQTGAPWFIPLHATSHMKHFLVWSNWKVNKRDLPSS